MIPNCHRFNGSTYFSIPNMRFDVDRFRGSLLAWIKPGNTQANYGWYITLWESTQNHIAIFRKNNNSQEHNVRYKAGNVFHQINLGALSQEWHLLVLTWDEDVDEVRAYLDGSEDDGSPLTITGHWPAANQIESCSLGGVPYYPAWKIGGGSKMTEVWVLADKVLSSSEISDIWSRKEKICPELYGAKDNTVGLFRFDELYDCTAKDYIWDDSSKLNHGHLAAGTCQIVVDTGLVEPTLDSDFYYSRLRIYGHIPYIPRPSGIIFQDPAIV